MNARGIQDGMAVYSADGEKLGKVISCDADGFLVEKGFFFPKEYFVRYEQATTVGDGEVRLALTKDRLREAGESGERPRTGGEAMPGRAPPPPIEREHETAAGALEASGRDELRTTLAEERLDVLKREREAGEVRLRKDVVTETKHLDVPVTREQVRVERAPLDAPREARPGEASFEEGTISMPIREEEVEIRKRPVVKEEIRLKRDRVQHEQRADAQVRRETADIDDSDAKPKRDADLESSRGLGAPGKDDDLVR